MFSANQNIEEIFFILKDENGLYPYHYFDENKLFVYTNQNRWSPNSLLPQSIPFKNETNIFDDFIALEKIDKAYKNVKHQKKEADIIKFEENLLKLVSEYFVFLKLNENHQNQRLLGLIFSQVNFSEFKKALENFDDINNKHYLSQQLKTIKKISRTYFAIGKQIIDQKTEWTKMAGLMSWFYHHTDDKKLKSDILFFIVNYLTKAASIRYANSPTISRGMQSLNSDLTSYYRSKFHFLHNIVNEKIRYHYQLPFAFHCIENSKELEKVSNTLVDMKNGISLPFKIFVLEKPQSENDQEFDENIKQQLLKIIQIVGWYLISASVVINLKNFLQNFSSNEFIKVSNRISAIAKNLAIEIIKNTDPNSSDYAPLQIYASSGIPLSYITELPFQNLTLVVNGPIMGQIQADHLFKMLPPVGMITLQQMISENFTLDEILKINGVEAVHYQKNPLELNNGNSILEKILKKELKFGMNLLAGDFINPLHPNKAIKLIGNTIFAIVKDIFESMAIEKCKTLKNNELINTLLMKIMQDLAAAKNQQYHFNKFMQKIELVQYDIQQLLKLFDLYSEQDFKKYFKTSIKLPSDISPFLQEAGLSRSGMAISQAIIECVTDYFAVPYVECSPQYTYYEITEKVLPLMQIKDHASKKMGLFFANFFTNINNNLTYYTPYDVKGELLKFITKLETQDKTTSIIVAIDETIDMNDSGKKSELLMSFKDKIVSGQLCFIFFRSGQKFDMLGNDSLFGAPYYVIHNGDKKWDKINVLSGYAAKTDTVSLQWFAVINKVNPTAIDTYKNLIFKNGQAIIKGIGGGIDNNIITTIKMSDDFLPGFIELRLKNSYYSIENVTRQFVFQPSLINNNIVCYKRDSFGFPFCSVSNIGMYSLRIIPPVNEEDVKPITEAMRNIK